MKKNKLIVSLLFCLSIISCSRTHTTIDSDTIPDAFIMNSSSTFKGYFYQGSDNEFHYFVSKWDFEKDTYFRLKKEDLNIDTPYEFETKEVRIDLVKTDKKLGSNEFYQLYIVE